MPDHMSPNDTSGQAMPKVSLVDWLTDEDTDDLAVRRELAAASFAALGDFWDNEVDRAWQDFAPEVG